MRGQLVLALGPIQLSEVVERDADVRVVGTQRLFADFESAFAEGLGQVVLALGVVQASEVVERGAD